MPKTKTKTKEKKFDRNVEISAPIADPELIRAMLTPPKDGQRIDLKKVGFRALLSDSSAQDSIDECLPLDENHVPSYINISCAVSGYSNYNTYAKRHDEESGRGLSSARTSRLANRSRTQSPVIRKLEPEIHHIKVDKNKVTSPADELKVMTAQFNAASAERQRSPSPCIPPTEDDRHHGTYVGARYCPMPPPSKTVTKHIPLLGIDDDDDVNDAPIDPNKEDGEKAKVADKIASLYGDEFKENWRESMSHKAKKERSADDQKDDNETLKTPKELVALRPTPPPEALRAASERAEPQQPQVPTPNIKVLENVEKSFLTKLLTDEHPPTVDVNSPLLKGWTSPSRSVTPIKQDQLVEDSPVQAGSLDRSAENVAVVTQQYQQHEAERVQESPIASPIQTKAAAEAQELQSPPTSPQHDTSPSPIAARSPVEPQIPSPPQSPVVCASPVELQSPMAQQSPVGPQSQSPVAAQSPVASTPVSPPPLSPDSHKSLSISAEASSADIVVASAVQPQLDDVSQLIQYEVRSESPVDNQSSPRRSIEVPSTLDPEAVAQSQCNIEPTLVSGNIDSLDGQQLQQSISEAGHVLEQIEEVKGEAVSDEKDGHHYLSLLHQEIASISESVGQAEKLLESEEQSLDEDTIGFIRSAIGKANLLITKKCKQFEDLCNSNINGNSADSQFPTLNEDLAGFWDMLSIQINDVTNVFDALWRARDNNWQQLDSATSHSSSDDAAQKAGKTAQKTKLSAAKDRERHERLKEHINQMKSKQQAATDDTGLAQPADNLIELDESQEQSVDSDTPNSQDQPAEPGDLMD